MRLRYARFRNWLTPTLPVPMARLAPESTRDWLPAAVQPRRHHGLEGLFGHAAGGRVVIVTRRGVEIPLALARGWSVVALQACLAEIEALPEVMPESRAA